VFDAKDSDTNLTTTVRVLRKRVKEEYIMEPTRVTFADMFNRMMSETSYVNLSDVDKALLDRYIITKDQYDDLTPAEREQLFRCSY